MFYVKEEVGGVCIRIDITDENIYSACPKCGNEMQLDLADVFPEGDIDLFGTAVYCEACSRRML